MKIYQFQLMIASQRDCVARALKCFLFAWVLCGFMSPGFAQSVGQRAPQFSASDLLGHEISLQRFEGKVVYLDFWASWCPPCRDTLPWMREIQDRYAVAGLQVIAVNLDKNRAAAEKLIEQLAPGLPVALDPKGEIASRYSLPAMPTSFLIDRAGQIVHVQSGFRDGDGKKLELQIQELLHSAGARQ